jgi:hypothetical protein
VFYLYDFKHMLILVRCSASDITYSRKKTIEPLTFTSPFAHLSFLARATSRTLLIIIFSAMPIQGHAPRIAALQEDEKEGKKAFSKKAEENINGVDFEAGTLEYVLHHDLSRFNIETISC